MTMAFSKASCQTLIFALLLLCNLRALEAQTPAPAPGLSYTFYRTTCPNLETIVRQQLQTVFASDIGQAAGLLRLHFHDCFVQGCDASVLLDGSASGPSEKDAPPNLTLRAQAFVIIENLRRLVHNACNRTVSCADITALAARDAVFLSGGPNYSIPLGRRDGLTFATVNVTLANLPPPTANASFILESLSTKGFTPTDVVSLSGGHTIGIGHCGSFSNRIFPSRDPSMDQTFFNNLRLTCPTNTSNNTTVLDIRSPNVFDNKYYVDLMNRQGLFTSDQDLYTDSRTRTIVTNFAVNQTLSYQNFINAMIKMGQLNVLTGTQGEIRANCSRRNSNDLFILPNMERDQDEKVASY
uniref:Peroxidase n=1 Tax=Artemisia annua TaxID=35608 RepID=A0A2H4FBE7_ARTAN|nr:peroxidase [Artemisia annua]